MKISDNAINCIKILKNYPITNVEELSKLSNIDITSFSDIYNELIDNNIIDCNFNLLNTLDITKVNSSSIKTIGYYYISNILEVQFVNSDIWKYEDVPNSVWEEFRNHQSIGKYFYSKIKNKYKESKEL